MKNSFITKYFLTLLASLTFLQSQGQSVSYIIPEQYNEILILSVSFSYSSSGTYTYSYPFGFYGAALETMQARYDQNHKIISKEYNKLKDLELINKTNQKTLQTYKDQRLDWIYKAGSNWDLGNQDNANKILNYCCEIYSYPSIKKELKLLQKCETELTRLKTKDPDSYLYTPRYRAISKLLSRLADCPTDEIGNLNWESIELEDNATSVNTSEASKKMSAAYVTSATLKVRASASTKGAVITTLNKGDKVEIIETVNSNWTKVRVTYFDSYSKSANTTSGYVYSQYISSEADEEEDPLVKAYLGLKQPYGDGKGKIIFYSSSSADVAITIYVAGNYVGKITQFVPDNETLGCDDPKTVSAILAAGVYNYTAQGANSSWKGTFDVIANECSARILK